MAWKPVEAKTAKAYEDTVSITIRDIETGQEQTIVSNRIHPFFVQIPDQEMPIVMATTGTDGPLVSSEGHTYRGEIENGYWVDAVNLKSGYRLLNPDKSWAEVTSVEIEKEPLQAFNITVQDFHTYFVAANDNAEPVWVHNKCIKFSRLKYHFEKHAKKFDNMNSVDDYKKSIVNNLANGKRFKVRHEGRTKYNVVSRIGSNQFLITSTNRSGTRIFTHHPGNRGTLRGLGIKLPHGF